MCDTAINSAAAFPMLRIPQSPRMTLYRLHPLFNHYVLKCDFLDVLKFQFPAIAFLFQLSHDTICIRYQQKSTVLEICEHRPGIRGRILG